MYCVFDALTLHARRGCSKRDAISMANFMHAAAGEEEEGEASVAVSYVIVMTVITAILARASLFRRLAKTGERAWPRGAASTHICPPVPLLTYAPPVPCDYNGHASISGGGGGGIGGRQRQAEGVEGRRQGSKKTASKL